LTEPHAGATLVLSQRLGDAVAEGDALERLLARARAAAARAAEVQAHTASLAHEWDAAARRPRRCAWCGRVEIGGRWRTEQEVPPHFKARRDPASITHGICEDCFEELRATGRSR